MTTPTIFTVPMVNAEAGNARFWCYPLFAHPGSRDRFEAVEGMVDANHAALDTLLTTEEGTVHETTGRYLDAVVLRAVLRRRDGFAEIMYDTDRSRYVVVSSAAWPPPAR